MARFYCTPAEFTNWPTGLDVQDLIPDAPDAQQTAQLAVILQGASSYADQLTYQPLYARSATDPGTQARGAAGGRLVVRLRSFPAASITAAQWQLSTVGGWNNIPAADCHIVGNLASQYYADDVDYRTATGWGNPSVTVMTQYVVGYPNAVTTAAVTAGATALDLDEVTGLGGSSTVGNLTLPGTTLTIYDLQGGQEDVTVDSVSGNTVTLTTGTQYGHAEGVRVSALPPAVTEACIYIAAWMIKERRAGGGISMEGSLQPMDVRQSEDLQMARQLLQPYKRVI